MSINGFEWNEASSFDDSLNNGLITLLAFDRSDQPTPIGTLYIGVASNLPQRIWQHKNHQVDGFTKKYNVTSLVYFEQAETMESAIAREKILKKIGREEKIQLIESNNPNWVDLYETIV